jgi:UDP-N-acetylmuramate--alanine ligase
MSALAQLLVSRGKTVTGSDRDESPTTELLRQKGIDVTIGHDSCLIPADAELLVYSDAVWPDNPERMRAAEMGLPQMSYFETLGKVSEGYRTIAVTGTHGKTTTTGMVAKILADAGIAPTAVVGSIVRDFESNFLPGSSEWLVVEACEYRDHMLQLKPEILVLTNAEWDHTDFFPSFEAMQASFRTALERVPETGTVVVNTTDPNVAPLLSGVRARIVDYTREAIGELQLMGEFNRENARAALAAARAAVPSLEHEAAVRSLSSFHGSWRRFEYKGTTADGVPVYDDYAHHPTAIGKTIAAVREKFPDTHLIVAFHPHLYSRTRDLMDGFASSLALADECVIAPIYPAREAPIPGITSDVLAAKIAEHGTPARAFDSLDAVYSYLAATRHLPSATCILLTMGAGDIYKVAERLVVTPSSL